MASTINGTSTGSGGLITTGDDSGVLNIQTNETTAITVDASQIIGVGVTPSAWNNTVFKTIQMNAQGALFATTTSMQIGNNIFYDGAYKFIGTGYATRYYQASGEHAWLVSTASGTAGGAITETQAMTLATTGNLGIGTTSPSGTATSGLSFVSGTASVAYITGSNSTGQIWLGNNNNGSNASDGTNCGTLAFRTRFNGTFGGANDIASVIGTYTGDGTTRSGAIRFLTLNSGSEAERARIAADGVLLVGTSTTFNGTSITQVSGNPVANQVFSARHTGTNPNGMYLVYTGATPNGGANYFILASDGTTRFYVASNGGIGNYSGNNVNLSDRREKTNFAPATSYLDKICAIPVQTFNYIDQNLEEDGGLTLGVVAQDVQAIAPELVMESNWAGKDEEPKMRLSVYQTDLQYALMKCIQEQQALIETLTQRITALEGA